MRASQKGAVMARFERLPAALRSAAAVPPARPRHDSTGAPPLPRAPPLIRRYGAPDAPSAFRATHVDIGVAGGPALVRLSVFSRQREYRKPFSYFPQNTCPVTREEWRGG